VGALSVVLPSTTRAKTPLFWYCNSLLDDAVATAYLYVTIEERIVEETADVPEEVIEQFLRLYTKPMLTVITQGLEDNEVVVPEVFFAKPPIDSPVNLRDHLKLYEWRWWWAGEMDVPIDIERLIP